MTDTWTVHMTSTRESCRTCAIPLWAVRLWTHRGGFGSLVRCRLVIVTPAVVIVSHLHQGELVSHARICRTEGPIPRGPVTTSAASTEAVLKQNSTGQERLAVVGDRGRAGRL